MLDWVEREGRGKGITTATMRGMTSSGGILLYSWSRVRMGSSRVVIAGSYQPTERSLEPIWRWVGDSMGRISRRGLAPGFA